MKQKYLTLITVLCTLIICPATAYPQRSILRGIILAADNTPVQHVTVHLKGTNHSCTSGSDGKFTLTAPAGNYTLVASSLGYETVERSVEMKPGQHKYPGIVVRESALRIDDVQVQGKSLVQQVKESSYNVVAIDASALHNTTLDLAHTLDRISGIKLRETGGVGSGTQISLNGFSGRHVKVFMDGMPMEGSGSSFQINNIPVSLAERIEVYKGVVPIELGADALGGAINIITRNTANTYLDASYSFGSFNTHKSNISFGHVTAKGFMVQLNAYQNYSDNSFKVKTQLLDLQTNTFSNEEYWFKRFHDAYRNEAFVFKTGVTGKKWATRMLFGITLSQERDEIQNANLMKIVYGGKVRESRSITPSFNYEKKNFVVRNLDLSISANYNLVRSNSTDTLARQYNWLGEYREKSSKGEGVYTLSESDNNSLYITANLRYRIGTKHFFTFNNVFNSYSRKATDKAATSENSTEATFMKRTSNKNVLGFSYKYALNRKFNLSAFGKYYDLTVTGPVDVSTTTTAVYEEKRKSYNTLGYGAAATYMFTDQLQVKASYEQAYRLPSERELFGDEVLENGDAALKPESSRNMNLNFNYNNTFSSYHTFYAEAGLIYRDTRDYIRRQIEQRYGGAYYTNHGKVQTLGVDLEASYFYKDKFSAGGNITYQNIRNMERYSATGLELIYYKDRLPNVPYLFSNFNITYNIHNVLGRRSTLSLSYNLNYVHEFFRNWESEGADIIIPSQLSHDLSATFSFANGTYNLAVEATNITNVILYDNYSLQKPGRSFSAKFRYFMFKTKDNGAKVKNGKASKGKRHGRHEHRGL